MIEEADLKSTTRVWKHRAFTRVFADPFVTIGALALFSALVIFGFETQALSQINGWWIDELASINYSNPALGFRYAITHRILSDSNPPLYYLLLFLIRHVIHDGRSAMVVLNLAGLAGGCIAVSSAARASGRLGLSLISNAAFILNGAVLRYVVEGRSYLLALTLTYVATWICLLAVAQPERRQRRVEFALVGALAALTHLFGAIYCCSLAVGLMTIALAYKRPQLMATALTLGASAAAFTLLWLPFGMASVNRINWLTLSVSSVLTAWNEVMLLALGPSALLILFSIVLIVSIYIKETRIYVLVFAITATLFIGVPILISIKQPIIYGRYWLIGAPSVLVYSLFVAQTAFNPPTGSTHNRLLYALGAFAAALIVLADATGFYHAQIAIRQKLIWYGASIVRPFIDKCGIGSVRTNDVSSEFFGYISHRPKQVFVRQTDSAAIAAASGAPKCAVVAWAEHVTQPGLIERSSDAALLRWLQLDIPATDVRFVRQKTGFVVLRASAPAAAPGNVAGQLAR